MKQLIRMIANNSVGLGIFAVFTAGVIAVTQFMTQEQIVKNQLAYQSKLLFEILPDAPDNLIDHRAVLNETGNWQQLSLLNLSETAEYYVSPVDQTVLLPVVAPAGYTEAIRLIVGIDLNGQIVGVRVTAHKETPGLGDQIELRKSDWILQFNNQSLELPEAQWQVVKDGGQFDQLTGATITPRAIVRALHRALLFYRQNQQALLAGVTS
jgi:electron transport complex protein RnfG